MPALEKASGHPGVAWVRPSAATSPPAPSWSLSRSSSNCAR